MKMVNGKVGILQEGGGNSPGAIHGPAPRRGLHGDVAAMGRWLDLRWVRAGRAVPFFPWAPDALGRRGLRRATAPGSPAVNDRAHRADALVADVLIGINGDNTARVLPAGVQRAKVKEEQCGFVAPIGVALSRPTRWARRRPGCYPPGGSRKASRVNPEDTQHATLRRCGSTAKPTVGAGRRHGHC